MSVSGSVLASQGLASQGQGHDGRSAKSRPLEKLIWKKKRTAPPSLQSGSQTKRKPRGCRSKEGLKSRDESSTEEPGSRAGVSKRQEEPGRTSPYPLRSGAGSRRRQGEGAATTSKALQFA
ncbi:hypothetical protein TNIN_282901 [Trichonephila inaurata madagascariensis]|uniref:Uncharacterized protein n=1 Tax=Trichonephila inaurata madagascariensis TaxID=2747483 RepID=A0A8X7CFG9_9ARAC|nr:hypothetical protein TNIN_282901 [Trichonephila inaurata madagascariensis]